MIEKTNIIPKCLTNLIILTYSPENKKVLKMFLNNIKTPIIPPLFYENRLLTDFTNKLFYLTFFLKQCTVHNNGSNTSSELLLKTYLFLSNISFSSDEILQIIQNLKAQKAHGSDRISI